MNNLTAQFIESFFLLKQENLLNNNFIEEIAMIEQLSSMKLSMDDEYHLETFIFKDIPKLQQIIHTAYQNEVLQNMKTLDNETVEDSIASQIRLIKKNFHSFFSQVFENEKTKIMANKNLLQQKSHNIGSTSNGAAPSLKTQPEAEIEEFAKPIVMPTAKSLIDIGFLILQENKGDWNNNFKRKSEIILSGGREPKKTNKIEVNTQSHPAKEDSSDKTKLIVAAAMFISIIVIVLSVF